MRATSSLGFGGGGGRAATAGEDNTATDRETATGPLLPSAENVVVPSDNSDDLHVFDQVDERSRFVAGEEAKPGGLRVDVCVREGARRQHVVG